MSDEITQSAEPDLMAMAMQADAADTSETPSPEQKETVQADEQASSDTTAEKAQETEKTEPEQKPNEPTKEAAPEESKFKKAQKEQLRLADSWKKLDQEKAALRAEREAIAREREEHRRHQETQHKGQDRNGPTPEDFEALASNYERQGRDDMAVAARQRASELRKAQTQQASANGAQEAWRTPEFQTQWQENVQRLIREDPTLADESNPVVGITNRLVNDSNYGRYFRSHPDGIRAANEVAKIIHGESTATAKVTGLQQELDKAKAEIQRLTKLTSIGGSHPATGNPATAKKATEISDDELMRMGANADAQGG